MRKLDNLDLLAFFQVGRYDCMTHDLTVDCTDCPYFAHVESDIEDIDCGCISIYLKQIADKYYTRRQND